MKKKICILVLSLCVATSFAACGESSSDSDSAQSSEAETQTEDTTGSAKESEEAEEITADTRVVSVSRDDMDKYVTLGKYKGLTVTKEVEEVTEEAIDEQIESYLSESMETVEDAEATVQDGDTVNIDYVGKIDGVAFENGSAEAQDLTIGSGSFIDGFEEGLIGARVGDTLDLNLTFPEDYGSEDLAGKDAVFTVTVNEIKRAPSLTEEWVAANTDYDTLDAYREGVRQELEESNASSADDAAMNNVWSQILEDSEVKEFPQDDIDEAVAEYQASLDSYAQQSDMDNEEFLESQGMTQEEFDEQAQQYAEYLVKQNLVVQAIMDAEGITLVDDKSKEAEEELASQYGVESIDDLISTYGQDTVYRVIALSRVGEFVLENAEVTETIATDDDKEGFDADAATVEDSDSSAEDSDTSSEEEAADSAQ